MSRTEKSNRDGKSQKCPKVECVYVCVILLHSSKQILSKNLRNEENGKLLLSFFIRQRFVKQRKGERSCKNRCRSLWHACTPASSNLCWPACLRIVTYCRGLGLTWPEQVVMLLYFSSFSSFCPFACPPPSFSVFSLLSFLCFYFPFGIKGCS